jgi:hypothetical protein
MCARHIPAALNVKLTTHVRRLEHNAMLTPIECFFPAHNGIERTEIPETGEDACSLLLELIIPQGRVWLSVQTSSPGVKLELAVQQGAVVIGTKYSGSLGQTPYLILTHIDPHTCTLCSAVAKHKCRRCWEELSISVRYCDKACQRAHFGLQHKHVCGRPGDDASRAEYKQTL